jgi:putative transposase
VSVRGSPTEKIRREIDALSQGDVNLATSLEQVARLGARLIIQTALEVEVEEFLPPAQLRPARTAAGELTETVGAVA